MADGSADGPHHTGLTRDGLTRDGLSRDGLSGEGLARDAALLKDTVREAGALALSLFRTELKNWTKGASSPVSELFRSPSSSASARTRSRALMASVSSYSERCFAPSTMVSTSPSVMRPRPSV